MKPILYDFCGGSGAWSEPWKKTHQVNIITLPETDLLDINPGDLEKPDVILFASPCTVWANSGARWWINRTPDEIFEHAAVLAHGLYLIAHMKPRVWCIENPIGRMTKILGPPVARFNPCDYGDPYTKMTYLWGEFNMPQKNPVEPIRVCSQGSWVQKLGGKSEKTKYLRSLTPSGFANAFYKVNYKKEGWF